MIRSRTPTSEQRYLSVLPRLQTYRLVYLASPYTKYAHGLDAAAQHAAAVAGRLVEDGVRVFAPVVYTHALNGTCAIDPTHQSFWLEFDAPFMEACEALAVAMLPGWDSSAGVNAELNYFGRRNAPLHMLPSEWLIGEAGE